MYSYEMRQALQIRKSIRNIDTFMWDDMLHRILKEQKHMYSIYINF